VTTIWQNKAHLVGIYNNTHIFIQAYKHPYRRC